LIKRWFFLSMVGFFLAGFGFAIWANLTPLHYTIRFIRAILEQITRVIPSHISGPLVLVFGLLLIFWGQSRTVSSITEVLMPEQDEELVDLLLTHRRLNRGPRIVVLGGGTGLSNLLRGLKDYSSNITAIVTVADDGGSSGRLRREMGVQPPGDIRNCLTALAKEEKLLTELFSYRFEAGEGLSGHSFGNLFLSAMTEITDGDFEQAIAASSQVLAVRGQVLPATLTDVQLWADLADGRHIEGESNITEAQGQIVRIGCKPENPPALPTALRAIEAADYVILGPGSLYTSIIPNLLVPELAEAIARCPVPRLYICNIMTQPGETQGYTVADHIRAIDRVCPRRVFDAVVVQQGLPSAASQAHYAQRDSYPVVFDREAVQHLNRRIIATQVMVEDAQTHRVHHDSQRLARELMRWYKQVGEAKI
jgi:uncharacterized cofD-like protein